MIPVIGKRHKLRNGDITKVIVSAEGISPCFERYPFMEIDNTDPVSCWACNGSWDDRGSEWPWDIIGIEE